MKNIHLQVKHSLYIKDRGIKIEHTDNKWYMLVDGKFGDEYNALKYSKILSPRPSINKYTYFSKTYLLLKDLLKDVEEAFKAYQIPCKLNIIRENLYFIKENTLFYLFKENKSWTIAYLGSNDYQLYNKELKDLSFTTRSEALACLKNWFNYHKLI